MKLPNTAILLTCASLVLPQSPATAGHVSNPSFEDSYEPSGAHYGPIASWTGGSGSNNASGPFHNGATPIPDRSQIAFMQGTQTMSQAVSGLTPGEPYWIQFFYDARNCCNGGTINLAVKWDATTLDTIPNIPVSTGGAPYKFRNIAFTPTASSGTLTFATAATGDATALIDAVCVVPRTPGQVVVMNPSFEASGTPPYPGTSPAVAGWTSTIAIGVNDAASPFADNGAIPEQDHVGVLQGDASISQTLRGLAVGEIYAVSFRYNARSGNAPTLDVRVAGNSIFNAAITPVGGVEPYYFGSGQFTASATSAVLSFVQTAPGDHTILLDDIRVEGVFVEPIPNLLVRPQILEIAPGLQDSASFTVSARRLEESACTIVVRTANPAVADFVGANGNGEVSLFFAQGGPETTLTAQIEGVVRGATSVVVVDNGGHEGVDGTVQINVVSSFVRNPSFDAAAPSPGAGYGAITAWTNAPASSGLNNGTMPFFDNGLVPDRANVAFLQGGPQSLSQQISNLIPGESYAIQAFYNARNCCGGIIDFTVRFAGVDIETVSSVSPVGAGQPFHFVNVPFVAGASSGQLEFVLSSSGDASVLLDGICIVPQSSTEIVVQNPSFEASGSIDYPGYMGALAGWESTGGHGVNVDGVGPFSDNGAANAQDRVAFLQQQSSISQMIHNLNPGASYTLTFLVNARYGDTLGPAPYRVSIDGVAILDDAQDAVGAGNPYVRKSLTFIPANTSALLKFEGTAQNGEDQTLLLDDIHIFPIFRTLALDIAPLAGNAIELTWPTTAPPSLALEFSTSMTEDSWQPLEAIPYQDGGMWHALDVIDGPKKFYRLTAP